MGATEGQALGDTFSTLLRAVAVPPVGNDNYSSPGEK
jgi:hypothetical protein